MTTREVCFGPRIFDLKDVENAMVQIKLFLSNTWQHSLFSQMLRGFRILQEAIANEMERAYQLVVKWFRLYLDIQAKLNSRDEISVAEFYRTLAPSISYIIGCMQFNPENCATFHYDLLDMLQTLLKKLSISQIDKVANELYNNNNIHCIWSPMNFVGDFLTQRKVLRLLIMLLQRLDNEKIKCELELIDFDETLRSMALKTINLANRPRGEYEISERNLLHTYNKKIAPNMVYSLRCEALNFGNILVFVKSEIDEYLWIDLNKGPQTITFKGRFRTKIDDNAYTQMNVCLKDAILTFANSKLFIKFCGAARFSKKLNRMKEIGAVRSAEVILDKKDIAYLQKNPYLIDHFNSRQTTERDESTLFNKSKTTSDSDYTNDDDREIEPIRSEANVQQSQGETINIEVQPITHDRVPSPGSSTVSVNVTAIEREASFTPINQLIVPLEPHLESFEANEISGLQKSHGFHTSTPTISSLNDFEKHISTNYMSKNPYHTTTGTSQRTAQEILAAELTQLSNGPTRKRRSCARSTKYTDENGDESDKYKHLERRHKSSRKKPKKAREKISKEDSTHKDSTPGAVRRQCGTTLPEAQNPMPVSMELCEDLNVSAVSIHTNQCVREPLYILGDKIIIPALQTSRLNQVNDKNNSKEDEHLNTAFAQNVSDSKQGTIDTISDRLVASFINCGSAGEQTLESGVPPIESAQTQLGQNAVKKNTKDASTSTSADLLSTVKYMKHTAASNRTLGEEYQYKVHNFTKGYQSKLDPLRNVMNEDEFSELNRKCNEFISSVMLDVKHESSCMESLVSDLKKVTSSLKTVQHQCQEIEQKFRSFKTDTESLITSDPANQHFCGFLRYVQYFFRTSCNSYRQAYFKEMKVSMLQKQFPLREF